MFGLTLSDSHIRLRPLIKYAERASVEETEEEEKKQREREIEREISGPLLVDSQAAQPVGQTV